MILTYLGKIYSNVDLVNKILRSLPSHESLNDYYSRGKRFDNSTSWSIIRSPVTHKMILREGENKKKKGSYLKAITEQKRSLRVKHGISY